jgi:Bax protein
MKCLPCWGPFIPYVSIAIALLAWWLSWGEVTPFGDASQRPVEQEMVRLDEESDDAALGMQVTLIPAPNFAEISLSNDRKQSFIAYLLPLIGSQNAIIAAKRKEAVRLYGLSQQNRLSLAQKEWLVGVATDYEVDVTRKGFDLAFWQNLLHRLDVVPPSLVLTQAAIESGWGVSRLAKEANNFFGIMCFKVGCGVKMPNVAGEFRRFGSEQEGVAVYMHIINTKGAYRAARMERMRNRLLGDVPSGLALAKTLLNYSELGSRYVAFLIKIMHENQLEDYDGADMQQSIEVVAAPPVVTPSAAEQVSP